MAMEDLEITDPVTVEEWGRYISALDGAKLQSVAVAANTLTFVETLKEEGMSGDEITDVLLMFALQFQRRGLDVPAGFPGEYTPYPDLLEAAAEY